MTHIPGSMKSQDAITDYSQTEEVGKSTAGDSKAKITAKVATVPLGVALVVGTIALAILTGGTAGIAIGVFLGLASVAGTYFAGAGLNKAADMFDNRERRIPLVDSQPDKSIDEIPAIVSKKKDIGTNEEPILSKKEEEEEEEDRIANLPAEQFNAEVEKRLAALGLDDD